MRNARAGFFLVAGAGRGELNDCLRTGGAREPVVAHAHEPLQPRVRIYTCVFACGRGLNFGWLAEQSGVAAVVREYAEKTAKPAPK